ncbi:hypothetical protein ES707_22120 [subsurface metagenome]
MQVYSYHYTAKNLKLKAKNHNYYLRIQEPVVRSQKNIKKLNKKIYPYILK